MLRFRPARTAPPPGPLVFLHIPKTAGTSLSHALGALRPWRHVLSDHGNISLPLLHDLAALPAAERAASLVFGHAPHGSLDMLDAVPDATTVTVLRDPASHAVSAYLHVRRDPDADLHDEATVLPFDAFVRRNWQFLVFQSISLDVARSPAPITGPEQFYARVPAIFALLDRIHLVATTGGMQLLVDAAARRLSVPAPAVPRLHRATELGIDPAERSALRRSYASLVRDPALAPLVAIERLLFDAARRREAALATPPTRH